MKCKKCGANVKDGLKFCKKCGADVETGAVPTVYPIETVMKNQKMHRFVRNAVIIAVALIAAVIVFIFVYRQL